MKYSIITVNYNNKEGLRKTIESVVNQTCQDFDYIVIDGGSTDGSVEIIKEYSYRIDYWVSESDKGIYNAMNKGILQAHGEYLNFMNSGDCFNNYFVLERIIDCKEDIVGGDIYRNDINEIVNFYNITSFQTLCVEGFNHQALFFKRSLFDARLYDENLRLAADWKFVLQCFLSKCSYKHIDWVIVNYECGGLSGNKELMVEERIKIIDELLPPLIAADYKKWMLVKSPIWHYLPQLYEGYRTHKIAVWLVDLLIKVRMLYRK